MKQSLLSYLITSLRGMFTTTNTQANNCPPPVRKHKQPTETHYECKETHYEYVSTWLVMAEWYYFFTPQPHPLRPCCGTDFG